MEVKEFLAEVAESNRFSAKAYPVYGKLSRTERRAFAAMHCMKAASVVLNRLCLAHEHSDDVRKVSIYLAETEDLKDAARTLLGYATRLCQLFGHSQEHLERMLNFFWRPPDGNAEAEAMVPEVLPGPQIKVDRLFLHGVRESQAGIRMLMAELLPGDYGDPISVKSCSQISMLMLNMAVTICISLGMSWGETNEGPEKPPESEPLAA
jgi:hypothetical protein